MSRPYKPPQARTSRWYSGSIKPDLPGWYEVCEIPNLHHNARGKLLGNPYRWWDGKRWWTGSPYQSWRTTTIFGTHVNHYWRGLTARAY